MKGQARRAGRCKRTRTHCRGQATAEFVLVLPLVVTVCLALAQVAVVARRDILVAHAAREAARAAAVVADDVAATEAARAAAIRSGALDANRLVVSVVRDEQDVHVVVRYIDPTNVAVVGRLVGPVTLQEGVTMRREDR